jgi:hypothetical protein
MRILGNTYSIHGEIDDRGIAWTSGFGGVRGQAQWQDLTRGGALILGTYRLSQSNQGTINLLRNFTQPPDPGPPDIGGPWRGTFENILSLMRGTDELMIQQDRTPTGAPSTGFMGQETRDTIIYDFVGTIDGQGNFVRVGVSIRGWDIGGGKKVESDELKGTAVETDTGFDCSGLMQWAAHQVH